MTSTVVLAQRGTSIVTRIHFARGRTTTVERGSVHRGMSHDYLLKLGAGQTMTVHLAARGAVNFDILTPGESDTLAQGTKDWSETCRDRAATALTSCRTRRPKAAFLILWKLQFDKISI